MVFKGLGMVAFALERRWRLGRWGLIRPSWHFGLATRVGRQLQLISALWLFSFMGLACSSIYFAVGMSRSAAALLQHGAADSVWVGDVESLLLQHRAVVTGAAGEVDSGRLETARGALWAIAQDIGIAMSASGAPATRRTIANDAASPQALEAVLPELFEAGDRVSNLIRYSNDTLAMQAALGEYTSLSGLAMDHAARWRDASDQRTRLTVSDLAAELDLMVHWTIAWTALAVMVTFVVRAVARGLLTRLWALRHAMLHLADEDDLAEVPYVGRPDEIGGMARALRVFRDKTWLLRERDGQLLREAMRVEAALGNMSQGLLLFDAEGRLDVFNKQFCTIFGMDLAQVRVGMPWREMIELGIAAGHHQGADPDTMMADRQAMMSRGEESLVVHRLGTGRLVAVKARPVPGGGWVGTYEDVTDRKAADARIDHLTRHDSVTGLPNRMVLEERIDQALTECGRGGRSATLCLNLDHFKRVNDALGHAVGDRLLVAVAERLQACVREGDTVGRLGADTFAIVQSGIARPEDAKLLAERIIGAMAVPFEVEGHNAAASVSIGLALMPEDGLDSATLLKSAELALYRAKSNERGTFCFFEGEMNARLQRRRQLELDLRTALRREEFELYYQPLVDPVTEEVCGFEALLRWRHPSRGMVSPAEFIPIAEEIGLIIPLGEWVIRHACAEAATWPERVKVALNLSPIQFRSRNLVPVVKSALCESGLGAGRLELEVTETVLLHDNESTLAVLHEFRALGVRISMDDFGTGYSSLSYLRSFPFDKIKIDQSFIRDLSRREDSIHIVRAIKGLCAGLGMTTTAEGVETEEELAKVRAEGCTEVQGFLFSRPRPAAEVGAMLREVRQRVGAAVLRDPLMLATPVLGAT